MNPKRSFETSGPNGPVTFPSRDEIERHVARSRQLRAEATAAMLGSAGRTLTRLLRRLEGPVRRQRQGYRGVLRYGDDLLADAASRARTSR